MEGQGAFVELLLVRLLRPDRLQEAAMKYATCVLGEEITKSRIVVDVARLASESTSSIPTLFLLSEGVDPSQVLSTIARKHKQELVCVSMGACQEVLARKALSRIAACGGWLFLQNIHLAVEYCTELAEQLRTYRTDPKSLHCDARIWLSSAPNEYFPVSLLQQCFRVSDEPPRGIRAALLRSYSSVSQDQLDSIPVKEWRQLLYAVCFLHAVVTERGRFGSLGWSHKYEFAVNDLSTCLHFLYNHMYSETKKAIAWKSLQFMTGEVHFGGRIVDEYDKRVMAVYCERWLNENLLATEFVFEKGYACPDFRTVDEYREYIESCPAEENPSIFGLHSNASSAQNQREANCMLAQLMTASVTIRSSEAPSKRESTILGVVDEILRTVVHHKAPSDKTVFSPLWAFGEQENVRMAHVAASVCALCTYVKDAVCGLIVASPQVADAMDRLYDGQIPN